MASSRRQFFKTGSGLLIGFSLADSAIVPQLLAAETVASPKPGQLDSWLRIEKDESIKVFTGKVDIGMGIRTALSQIVAEELDVPVSHIELIMGDTGTTPDQGGVGGSNSISGGARPLRVAAATARYLLVQLASDKLGIPAEQLQVKDGVVSSMADSTKNVSYGALAGGTDLNDTFKVSGDGGALNLQGRGKPKDPSAYTIVGQPVPRADLAQKFFGRSTYVTDVRVDGMLHGRVIRPSSVGAALVNVDDAAARKIPGFTTTVVKGDFVGVVAESEWAAIRASKEVKVTWGNVGDVFPDDLYQHMRTAAPKSTREGQKKGDAVAALSTAARKIEASYEWPFQTHSTMGPGCSVADVRPDGVTTVWCGGQKPHAMQQGVAEMLHVPPDRVRVIWVEDAGSYGRAGYEDVAADAVLLSQAVGKPVRVQWMRADMTQWGAKGPPVIVDLVAGLDAQGGVTALQMTSWALSGTEIIPQANSPGNMLAAQLTGAANTTGRDEFVQWGSDTASYSFPNIHSVGHIVPPLYASASPLRTTHLRDPNGPAGTFCGESFIDEIAAATEVDPVEFRLKYTENPRAKKALTTAAEHAKWDTRPSPKHAAGNGDVLTGRGVALGLRGGTHVATVAEVEVNRNTGAVRVKRLVCAHDCGLIVNPDLLRGTISASLVQSTGRTLKEEVTFDRGNVTSVDWKTYPVAKWSDVPEVEVILLNHPELPSTGAGEPSTRPTAAAINNAIFDATGVRMRQAPLTASKIKAALGQVQKA